MDEASIEKISDIIFNLIPGVTRLKELYQKWDKLDEEDKLYLDTQIERWNSPGHVQLYKTVKRALDRWGNIQDTEGAPGCEPGWFNFPCDIQLEEELINVLQTVEHLLKRAKENPKPIHYHMSNMADEMSTVSNFPIVPPSSPDSETDDFLYLNTPEKQRSEPFKACERSLSLHSGRRLYQHCHTVKSAPVIKDGYNTD